jgi:hypothetical protein
LPPLRHLPVLENEEPILSKTLDLSLPRPNLRTISGTHLKMKRMSTSWKIRSLMMKTKKYLYRTSLHSEPFSQLRSKGSKTLPKRRQYHPLLHPYSDHPTVRVRLKLPDSLTKSLRTYRNMDVSGDGLQTRAASNIS